MYLKRIRVIYTFSPFFYPYKTSVLMALPPKSTVFLRLEAVVRILHFLKKNFNVFYIENGFLNFGARVFAINTSSKNAPKEHRIKSTGNDSEGQITIIDNN